MIKLELKIEEVNLILTALQELPFKLSAELIAKIKTEGDKQFKEQNKKDKTG
jgi:hypothetical protein